MHRNLLLAATLACAACASKPSVLDSAGKRVLLAFDDGKADGAIALSDARYESVLRFELPPAERRLGRLWIHAAAPGTVRWALYEHTVLETPGAVVAEGTRAIAAGDVSDGRDGVWLTQELTALAPRKGVLWLGLKKVEGEPAIWASSADARTYFVRGLDPRVPMDLLPVRRAPHVRLEVEP